MWLRLVSGNSMLKKKKKEDEDEEEEFKAAPWQRDRKLEPEDELGLFEEYY